MSVKKIKYQVNQSLNILLTLQIQNILLLEDCVEVIKIKINRHDGVVVRASASQSVDLGFIPLVESYQNILKNGVHSFSAWRLALMRGCGEQAGKLACCIPWARHLTGRPTFIWKTDGPDTSEIATLKRVRICRSKHSDTVGFLVNGG